jgi:hypothetical protein
VDTSIRSYQDYYAKTDWTSRQVQPELIYQLFAVPLEGEYRSHGQLNEEIKRIASEMPRCYLMCFRDSPHIHAFHRASVHQPALGAIAEEWHDKVILFNGDVCGSQMPQPVYTPLQLLQATTTVRKVHPWQNYVLHYKEDVNAAPLAVSDEVVEGLYDSVHTRKAMYAARGAFVDRTLPRRKRRCGTYNLGSTPRVANGGRKPEKRVCAPNQLAACIGYGRRKDQARASHLAGQRTLGHPTHHSSTEHGERRPTGLEHRGTGASTGRRVGSGSRRYTTSLSRQVMESNSSAGRSPRAGQVDAPARLPSEHWKGTIDILLGLTQKSDKAFLAPLWHKYASCSKREQRTILQTALNVMGQQLRLPVPVATVELTNSLIRLEFASTFVNHHLDQGIQPFIVTYNDQRMVGDQKTLIETHEHMVSNGAPTLTDLVNLRASSKLPLPITEKKCKRTYDSFAVPLAVLLGVSHPTYKSYRTTLVDNFESSIATVHRAGKCEHRPSVRPYAQRTVPTCHRTGR